MTKNKIDFIGIGAAKSATTWIWKCLQEHPQICSPIKERFFFNKKHQWEKGIDYYQSLFLSCPKESIKGEITPEYMNHPETAERIYAYCPNVKILVCLRNPIERAYSYYWFRKTRGLVGDESFQDIVKKRHKKIIQGGLYYQHLKPFFEKFPQKQIAVLIYEDIEKDPVQFIQGIYRFLGVDSSFIPPSVHKKILVTSDNIPALIQKITRVRTKIVRWIKRGFNKYPPVKKFLVALVYKLMRTKIPIDAEKPLAKPPMDERIRQELREFYKKDIEELSKLLGRNLIELWK